MLDQLIDTKLRITVEFIFYLTAEYLTRTRLFKKKNI